MSGVMGIWICIHSLARVFTNESKLALHSIVILVWVLRLEVLKLRVFIVYTFMRRV
jgi:hypothetical protein